MFQLVLLYSQTWHGTTPIPTHAHTYTQREICERQMSETATGNSETAVFKSNSTLFTNFSHSCNVACCFILISGRHKQLNPNGWGKKRQTTSFLVKFILNVITETNFSYVKRSLLKLNTNQCSKRNKMSIMKS